MSRVSVKIVGASGQGINSVGEIIAKALKRSGYFVFGYREYPSLIKGGHASYQLDISGNKVASSNKIVDAVVSLDHNGLSIHLDEIKDGGYLIHDMPEWNFGDSDKKKIEEKNIKVILLPTEEIIEELNAPYVVQNVLFTGLLWSAFNQDVSKLKEVVKERFASKPKLIDLNMDCIDKGYEFKSEEEIEIKLPDANKDCSDAMLITGNQAIGLGAVHAGVRMFASYPMTPASSILTYLAEIQNKTGMVIKQAEDEITASQMASASYFMGTRAMTGTSGGGFDLMTETLSMVGIIESPMVFVLAQRPGPATGMPTWTAQGDLLLAVHSGHGEFPRCVMSVSDAEDGFYLTAEAHNIAERFQIPVILLTDKHTAESLFTSEKFDQKSYKIDRGQLVDGKDLSELKAEDRFMITDDGVSPRWVPGQAAPGYNATSYENLPDGTVTEDSVPAKEMFDKRMRKMEALKNSLPEPELFGSDSPETLIIGWGSTKGVMSDVLSDLDNKKIGYLHYSYIWPLKTEKLLELSSKAKKVVIVEGNNQSQLGMLIKQETGLSIDSKILKYDGRPFFYEEILDKIS
jgi:2-oxoglutarate/2-oxoacid ferredoxin oxidoreductase subunit alpha